MIRVPDWVPSPLGRYYLYFAHHAGGHIRLAVADRPEGPWRIHAPGTLHRRDTSFRGLIYKGHIASPDVHVDYDKREIVMFFHGGYFLRSPHQATCVATSPDGLRFTSRREHLGLPYWRAFRWRDHYYALAMPGQLYRAPQLIGPYEPGPCLTIKGMRHPAVLRTGDRLTVFYSRIGDMPERILAASLDLSSDWTHWSCDKEQIVLAPREGYEGGELSPRPSRPGRIDGTVCELRDPFVFEEEGSLYLLYAVAGESGIAIAQMRRVS
jgi:hypothetical protein